MNATRVQLTFGWLVLLGLVVALYGVVGPTADGLAGRHCWLCQCWL